MKSGIYRFINDRTGEVYVGQSHNVFARRGMHHKELALGTHHNPGMQEDHDRGDKFVFEILEKMPGASREELEKREIHYIKKFNSFYEGYNQTPGGEYDKYKGHYKHGGGRLPYNKYSPLKPLTDCPDCGGNLIRRKGKYGNFAGCINYPKCSFSCSLKRADPASITDICESCGKALPEENYHICPFCGSSWDEDFEGDEELILKSNTSDPHSGISFKQFRSKKRGYFNRYDCEFLSNEYGIDIINANTVKESNSIIKNYLKENDLWDNAMEDLFIYNIRLSNVQYKQEIGEPVLGNCPECGNGLKRESEYFITCESYPDCNFSCIEDYYYDHVLKLSSEREIFHSAKNTNTENVSKAKSENSSIEKMDSKPDDKIKTEKTTAKENVVYCSNCGCKLNLEDTICKSCGTSIEGTVSEKDAIDETANIKDDANEADAISKATEPPTRWEKLVELIENISIMILLFSTFVCPILNVGYNKLIGVISFILAAYSVIFCSIALITEGFSNDVNGSDAAAVIICMLWNGLMCFLYYMFYISYIINP
ncbi:MAG: hypothetical protein E7Z79_02360 [Methanobrevibacter thaueri]|uniref:GIY-YIG domain-containing protein n=1 Tax=Methanobrevibacter thaueri TaxID=190975 RepID=A0A8T3VD47_9EURY|nr:topoisomerase DNA-binding C4 zinc finger domain-containing protein [Methanobrevibacter thaueri]MBE6501265.1 hypothetical protein [Methanobrevibacter thaueri]